MSRTTKALPGSHFLKNLIVSPYRTKKPLPELYLIASNPDEHIDLLLAIKKKEVCQTQSFEIDPRVRCQACPELIIFDISQNSDVLFLEGLKESFPVPIITLSQRPTMGMAVNVMRAGGCDFFPKPVSITAVIERLETLLEKRGATPNSTTASHHKQPSTPIMPFVLQERKIIENALYAFQGNITRAAEALQISPSTIHRKKQNWDYSPKSYQSN